jgi:starch-binding outer membrane protein, SusD/RagB family
MITINNLKKSFLMLFAVSFALVSCKDDFLNVAPTGSLANAQVATKAGVEGLLIGAYSALGAKGFTQAAGPNQWVWGSILGGEANKGTDPGDFSSINPYQRYETSAIAGDVNGTWNARYEGVARTNSVLRILAQAKDIQDADKKRIAGEARFLRGYYYFDLQRMFNKVPYVDEAVDDAAAGKVKNTVNWDKIEADFKFAYDNLPETQGQAGRANKWAAGAHLAKAYLYQKKFAEAKALLATVMTSGKTTNGKAYGLVPNYAQVFNAANDNHEESVFAVQTSINTGSVNNSNGWDVLNYPYNTGPDGPGNCCGFFQPSFALVNAFRTDATGLPLLDGSYNTGANQVANDYGIESKDAFTADAGNLDPRLDHSVGRRSIPYLDWIAHPGKNWIRSQPYAGPYSPKKYVYYKSQENTLTDGSGWTRGYSVMNYTIIRYADVLLWAAEAEIEAPGGDLAKARDLINQVRKRAANSDFWVKKGAANAAKYVISEYPAAGWDKAKATSALRFERMLELSGEGHRFFDLVRWGIAATELNTYLTYEGAPSRLVTKFGGAKFTAGKEYLPIPQPQIDISGKDVLTQNPSY